MGFDSVVFTVLVLGGLYWLVRHIYRILTQGRKVASSTLTLAEYLEKYPHCQTSKGIKCAVCNGSSIRNWGYASADDPRRMFICNQCNTRLYRTDNW